MRSYKIIATNWGHFRTHQFPDVDTAHCYSDQDMLNITNALVEKELGGYHQDTTILQTSIDKDRIVAITPPIRVEDESIDLILSSTLEQIQNQQKTKWVIYSPLHGGGHWTTLEIRCRNNIITTTKHDPLGGTGSVETNHINRIHNILTNFFPRGSHTIKFKYSPHTHKRQNDTGSLTSCGPIVLDEIRVLAKKGLGLKLTESERSIFTETRKPGVPGLRSYHLNLLASDEQLGDSPLDTLNSWGDFIQNVLDIFNIRGNTGQVFAVALLTMMLQWFQSDEENSSSPYTSMLMIMGAMMSIISSIRNKHSSPTIRPLDEQKSLFTTLKERVTPHLTTVETGVTCLILSSTVLQQAYMNLEDGDLKKIPLEIIGTFLGTAGLILAGVKLSVLDRAAPKWTDYLVQSCNDKKNIEWFLLSLLLLSGSLKHLLIGPYHSFSIKAFSAFLLLLNNHDEQSITDLGLTLCSVSLASNTNIPSEKTVHYLTAILSGLMFILKSSTTPYTIDKKRIEASSGNHENTGAQNIDQRLQELRETYPHQATLYQYIESLRPPIILGSLLLDINRPLIHLVLLLSHNHYFNLHTFNTQTRKIAAFLLNECFRAACITTLLNENSNTPILDIEKPFTVLQNAILSLVAAYLIQKVYNKEFSTATHTSILAVGLFNEISKFIQMATSNEEFENYSYVYPGKSVALPIFLYPFINSLLVLAKEHLDNLIAKEQGMRLAPTGIKNVASNTLYVITSIIPKLVFYGTALRIFGIDTGILIEFTPQGLIERFILNNRHNPKVNEILAAYEVLKLTENATKKEIQQAYRDLAKIYHPDKCQLTKKECEEMFSNIAKAYKTLLPKKAKYRNDQESTA